MLFTHLLDCFAKGAHPVKPHWQQTAIATTQNGGDGKGCA